VLPGIHDPFFDASHEIVSLGIIYCSHTQGECYQLMRAWQGIKNRFLLVPTYPTIMESCSIRPHSVEMCFATYSSKPAFRIMNDVHAGPLCEFCVQSPSRKLRAELLQDFSDSNEGTLFSAFDFSHEI